jgi:hypothetical protein
MIQISNRIITEINKDHAYLLKSKFFNDEGDKITGMQILDMILSCIKAHKNKFCYYMDVIDAYPHICDYTKEEAAQNNAVSFVQALFTMPKKAREFAIQEYATRLGNRKGNVHSMYNSC